MFNYSGDQKRRVFFYKNVLVNAICIHHIYPNFSMCTIIMVNLKTISFVLLFFWHGLTLFSFPLFFQKGGSCFTRRRTKADHWLGNRDGFQGIQNLLLYAVSSSYVLSST